ncbi:MAG: hypothetical protein OHK0053_24960 [Microscillaceae bacterium]
MNPKKLFLIGSLALAITVSLLAIAAFKLNTPANIPAPAPAKAIHSPKISKAPQTKVEKKKENYLSEKGRKFVQKVLVRPLQKKFNIKADTDQFSRCPSGFYFYEMADAQPEPGFIIVKLEYYDGCAPVDLCTFRVNEAENQLAIWDNAAEKYIDAEVWMARISKEDLEFRPEEFEQIEEDASQTQKSS